MQKILIPALVIVVASGSTTYASPTDVAKNMLNPMQQVSPQQKVGDVLYGSRPVGKENDRDTDQAPMLEARTVSSLASRVVTNKSEDRDEQTIPGSPQSPARQKHHGHHLRNALIAFGACFALAIVIAVAAK